MIIEGELEIGFVAIKDQIVDVLTKAFSLL